MEIVRDHFTAKEKDASVWAREHYFTHFRRGIRASIGTFTFVAIVVPRSARFSLVEDRSHRLPQKGLVP